MSFSLISPLGKPYAHNGFQSLSSRQTLSQRPAGSPAPRHAQGPAYVAPQWNPSIDVLVVPEGRALRLMRLSGGDTVWRRTPGNQQQHQTSALPDETDRHLGDAQTIRAIAWHPSGQHIAVLHANGTLVHRDTMRGDVAHRSRIDIDSGELVVSMQWVRCQAATPDNEAFDEKSELLPKLLLPRLSSLDKTKAESDEFSSVFAESMTAIVVVTRKGSVHISLGGIFSLPVSTLPQQIQPGADFTVLSAQLNEPASQLYLMLASQLPHGVEQVSTCRLNTQLLSLSPVQSPLLHTLVPLSTRISGLLLYLENAIGMVVKESIARDGSASRQSLLDQFERVLQDHGVDDATSPEAELIRLAVTGRASEPTAQFLLAKLKASKLNTWESAGRLGALAIVRLVYQHALPAIEHAILAMAQLLDLITPEKLNATDQQQTNSALHTRDHVIQVLVTLGWMHGRLEDFMQKVKDEQRENQEFVDWALFSIDDLQWQNEGSRRIDAGAPEDADDGSRPVRPEINYHLLLAFISTAFRRRVTSDFSFEDPLPTPKLVDAIGHEEPAQSDSRDQLIHAYFAQVLKEAHIEKLACVRSNTHKRDSSAGGVEDGLFSCVFHSQQILDAASEQSGVAGPVPTCQEALASVKNLVARALEWPSQTLGASLQWDNQAISRYQRPANAVAANGADIISDTVCKTARATESPVIYMASISDTDDSDHRYLQIVLTTETINSSRVVQSQVAVVELETVTSSSEGSKVPIQVTSLCFLDGSTLGLAFTVAESTSQFLGSLDISIEAGILQYHNLGGSHSTQDPLIDLTKLPKSPMVFARLLEINEASSRLATVLAANGRKGRRCVAVIERRGKHWWPYDMDNTEEEDDANIVPE
ncbi:hypothetical protein GGI07_003267 [Coemansia sp. Benny D115]|nr:hypothetical protein GGI07_003267 [Coemansia sp. Benny D115]